MRKLIKYEWTAMIREMLPVYVAILAVAAINYLLYRDILWTDRPLPDNVLGLLQTLSAFVYFGLLVALCAITVVALVGRFYHGLLGEEGYLMFTLPVRVWQLALSKALVALVICFLSCFTAILSMCILAGFDLVSALISLPGAVIHGVSEGMREAPELMPHAALLLLELLFAGVLWALSVIYHFYLSMSVGQLFRKNRVVWSVVSYVVIAFLTSLLGYGMLWSLSLLPEGLFIGFQENMESGAVLMAHMVLWMLILGQAVFFLLEMLPTHYILKRRLNLE